MLTLTLGAPTPTPTPDPNPNQVTVARLEPIKGQSSFVNWDARELPDAALRCAALLPP